MNRSLLALPLFSLLFGCAHKPDQVVEATPIPYYQAPSDAYQGAPSAPASSKVSNTTRSTSPARQPVARAENRSGLSDRDAYARDPMGAPVGMPQARNISYEQRGQDYADQGYGPAGYNDYYNTASEQGQGYGWSDYRQALDPYGDWRTLPEYGAVWIPNRVNRGWRPYVDGRWVAVDAGWMWESNEPWGSISYHYGYWTEVRNIGWVWVPGREWAPSRVIWREGQGCIGWAPLPPRQVSVSIQPSAWVVVPSRQFLAPRVSTVVMMGAPRVHTWLPQARVMRVEHRGHAYRTGPQVEVVTHWTGHNVQVAQAEPIRVRQDERLNTSREQRGERRSAWNTGVAHGPNIPNAPMPRNVGAMPPTRQGRLEVTSRRGGAVEIEHDRGQREMEVRSPRGGAVEVEHDRGQREMEVRSPRGGAVEVEHDRGQREMEVRSPRGGAVEVQRAPGQREVEVRSPRGGQVEINSQVPARPTRRVEGQAPARIEVQRVEAPRPQPRQLEAQRVEAPPVRQLEARRPVEAPRAPAQREVEIQGPRGGQVHVESQRPVMAAPRDGNLPPPPAPRRVHGHNDQDI